MDIQSSFANSVAQINPYPADRTVQSRQEEQQAVTSRPVEATAESETSESSSLGQRVDVYA